MPASSTPASQPPAHQLAHTPTPRYYVSLPDRLVTNMGRNTLAIGLYLLIGRLWHAQAVDGWVTLSDRDIQLFDPTLKRGGIRTALAKLISDGWLLAEDTGYKRRYCPTWGVIHGNHRPWRAGTPALARPPHVHTLHIDQQLIDHYMGRLTTRPTEPAAIKRMVQTPLLSLRDVGAYGRTLAGVSTPTSRLLAAGLLADGQALAVPPLPAILSQASTMLTRSGLSQLDWLPAGAPLLPHSSSDMRPDVFFVERSMALTMIATMITTMTTIMTDTMIPSDQMKDEEYSPPERPELSMATTNETMPRTPRTPSIQKDIQPSVLAPPEEGVTPRKIQKTGASRQKAALNTSSWTDTQQQLLDLGISAVKVHALHDVPPAAVAHALEQVSQRTHVRDRAAYVVGILETLREQDWRLPVAAQPDYVEPEWSKYTTGEYAESFRRDQPAPDADLSLRPEDRTDSGQMVNQRTPSAVPLMAPPGDADLWRTIQAELEPWMAPAAYRESVGQTQLCAIVGTQVTLSVPTVVVREVLMQRSLGPLKAAFERQLGYPVQLRIIFHSRSASETV